MKKGLKLIIYSMGQALYDRLELLDYSEIVAFADKNPKKSTLKGIPVVSLRDIPRIEFDFVVVFSNRYYDEIVGELKTETGISDDQILTREHYLRENPAHRRINRGFEREYLLAKGFRRILCYDNMMAGTDYIMREQFLPDPNGYIDLISDDDTANIRGLFDEVYRTDQDVTRQYEVAVASDSVLLHTATIERLRQRVEVIFSEVSYHNESAVCSLMKRYGRIRKMMTRTGRFVELVCDRSDLPACKIYMVMHKTYPVKEDELYTPLCVGGYEWEGHISESGGENIAYLNRKINECTALYWIWKNTSEPYVGMCHYRRSLYNGSLKEPWNRLDEYHIRSLLEDYDLILSEVAQTPPGQTVYEFIKASIQDEVFDQGYGVVREAIASNQPDYLGAFDQVMEGQYECVCNLFVAKRMVLDSYCQWLFSFLIEAAEGIEVTDCDPYSSRVIGFFAERMWMVWLKKNRVKVAFMPYDEIVVNPKDWSIFDE